MGSGADDHAEHNEATSNNGDVAATNQVGQATDEGAYSCKGQQIPQDEPGPAVYAANVAVDVWWCTSEEIDVNLAAGPQQGHCDEGHEALKGHLACWS